MTGSVTNNPTSQAQILQMLQQLAAQNSLANDLDGQNAASTDTTNASTVTPTAPGLTSGSTSFSNDMIVLLMQPQATPTPDAVPSSGQSTGQQSTFGQDFQQLVQAIQSGNLSAAQQAYSTLSQDISSQNQGGSSSDPNNPFVTALNQIGSDLQSGNMGGAQQTLSAMQQAHGAHHHHHGGGEDDLASQLNGSDSSTSSSSSGSSSTQPGTITETNADGSVTSITTNADGSVTTTTTPPTQTASSNPSDASALQDLLAALEQLGTV